MGNIFEDHARSKIQLVNRWIERIKSAVEPNLFGYLRALSWNDVKPLIKWLQQVKEEFNQLKQRQNNSRNTIAMKEYAESYLLEELRELKKQVSELRQVKLEIDDNKLYMIRLMKEIQRIRSLLNGDSSLEDELRESPQDNQLFNSEGLFKEFSFDNSLDKTKLVQHLKSRTNINKTKLIYQFKISQNGMALQIEHLDQMSDRKQYCMLIKTINKRTLAVAQLLRQRSEKQHESSNASAFVQVFPSCSEEMPVVRYKQARIKFQNPWITLGNDLLRIKLFSNRVYFNLDQHNSDSPAFFAQILNTNERYLEIESLQVYEMSLQLSQE